MKGRVSVGHPVDVASGVFFDAFADAQFPGIVPLVSRRFYSTAFLQRGPATAAALPAGEEPFGPGWRANWQYELRRTLDGFVLTLPDGTTSTFIEPRTAPLTSAGRIFSPADGLELRWRQDGLLAIIGYGFDRFRNTVLFQSRENDLRFVYVGQEQNARARVLTQYDTAGRLTGLTQIREQRALAIEYDSSDRVTRLVVRYPDGTTSVVKEFGYDDLGRLAAVSDVLGLKTTYGYGTDGRMVEERHRNGTSYTIGYDGRGRCVYVAGEARYQERTLSWDDAAKRTTVRDSHGAPTTYDFNDAGQVVAQTKPSGATTQYTFDALGRLASSTSPWGAVSSVDYDAIGRVVAIHRPDGSTKRYSHDDEHRLVEYVDPTGQVFTLERSAVHGVSRIWVPGSPRPWEYTENDWGEPLQVVDPAGAARMNRYDAYGNVSATSDWTGNVHAFEYDARGLRTAHVDPLGHRTTYEVDALSNLVAIRFPDGRVHRRTVSAGRTERLYTLPDGRISRVRTTPCGNVAEVVDEDGFLTQYEWDSEPGKLLAITNPRGEACHFRYDGDGRHVEMTMFDGRTYRKEWNGPLLVRTVDPAGNTIENEFDVFGRVVKQTRPDGFTEYEYDPNHRPTRIATGDATLTFSYDVRGNCVTEDQDGVVLTREYDAVRNQTALASSLGDVTRFEVDGNGDVAAILRAGVAVRVERDALAREVRRVLPDGGALAQWYDPVGRLTGQRLAASGGATVFERSYAYDLVGALAAVHDSLRGDAAFAHDGRSNLLAVCGANGAATVFAYDPARNRVADCHLTQGGAAALDQVRTYGSAPLLQRAVAAGGPVASRNVVHGDRLAVVQSLGRRVQYEYDANGRVVRKTVMTPDGASTHVFEWDSLGSLRRAVLPDGSAWTYRYDGMRRRIAKTSPTGETTRYVWDKFRIAYELKPDGGRIAWIHIDGGPPIIMDDGEIHHVISDVAGAPSELVSSNGTLEDVATKSAWGEGYRARLLRQPFLGQWFDEETGLHYNVFRYYDPEAGRYLSPDPIGLLGGHNLYAFVASPFEAVDPWGLSSYEDLRKKSPTDDIRDSLNEGPGQKTCPVFDTLHDRLEADHVVPLKAITQMDGFNKLTDAQQLSIANMEDNFVGIGKNANSSRQDKTWEEWEAVGGHSKLGTGNQDFLDEMKAKERALREKIQDEIDKKNTENARCGGG